MKPENFPFLSKLGIRSLLSALSDAQNHQSSLEKGSLSKLVAFSPVQRNQTHILDFSTRLLQYNAATAQTAGNLNSTCQPMSDILKFWDQVKHLDSYISHNWFIERRLTVSLMVSNWRVWFWVEYIFRQLCADSLVSHDQTTWVGQLIHKTYNHCLHRHTTEFQRDEYLPLPPMSIKLVQRGHVSGNAALDSAVQTSVSLMHKWMHFSSESSEDTPSTFVAPISPMQSRFIHLVLSTTLNTDVLFLPALQDAWRRLPTVVFNQRRKNSIAADLWADLEVALKNSLIGESETSIGALICAHAAICMQTPKSKALETPILTECDLDILGACSTAAGAVLDLSASWTKYNQSMNRAGTSGSGSSQHLGSPTVPVEPADDDSLPHSSITSAALRIASFLRDFYALHTETIDVSTLSAHQQSWLQKMSTHKNSHSGGQDFYSPLRELAYSRRRVTSSLGPFERDFIRTPGGFFSALVFRGVTFSCAKFLERSHNNRFASLEAWETAVAEAKSSGLSDSDICNVRAYGTAQPKRTINNAKAYWQAASTLWPELLRVNGAGTTGKISWKDGHGFLRKEDPNRQDLLPEIGPLTSLLLTIDLVYAGIFEYPTLDDFAATVWKVNLGGRKGLGNLKLASTSIALQDFQAMWKALYNATDQQLSAVERENMGWDMFILEHALCKGARLKHF